MLVFRFCKNKGAEFISHLDTMRHLQKIFVRANIPVEYSQGFHPHMMLFLSSPIGVGIQSSGEYCLAHTNIAPQEFIKLFNQYSPRGIKTDFAITVNKKVNLAGDIDMAEYKITGINKFDVNDILSKDEFIVTDKKGNVINVRDRIIDLKFVGDELYAKLLFGNITLRPDILSNELVKTYGGDYQIEKIGVFIKGQTMEDALR